MGNGASSHVKSIKPKRSRDQVANDALRDRRSNSDGCITESLSSSKSKVDLLQQQLRECQEMLENAEERAEKSKVLEQQIAEVEGQNFELTDKVTSLEEEVALLRQENEELNQEDFTETFKAKDQYIGQLEKEAIEMQNEIKKLRIKVKRRIKSAQTQLTETKQETALKIYSLKQEISQLEEENSKLTQRLDRASSAAKSRQSTVKKEEIKEEEIDSEWEDSRMKLILELSNQVSQQDEKIMQLEEKLSLKEQTIQELQKLQPRPPSGTRKGSASKLSKDIRLAADLSRPGSGDTNLNRGRMSSGISRHSVISREGVSVDLRPDADPDSGIALEEHTAQPSTRISSGSSQDLHDPDDGVSASRKRRRNKRIEKQMSADCVDHKTFQSSRGTQRDKFFDRQSSMDSSIDSKVEGDLVSIESDSRFESGGAKRKTKNKKEDFSTDADSKGHRASSRTKQHSTKSRSKLAANFSSSLVDPYDINDILNDYDSHDPISMTFGEKSWKSRKGADLSSAVESDATHQEISVP